MPQIPKMKAPALIKELKKRKIKPEKLPPPLPVTAAAPASRSAEPTAAVDGKTSHWRDCHFADALSSSLLKHLLKGEGGAAE